MKYAHIVDGKVVNFVEWDGVTPYAPGGELVPYVSHVHEPHTIPVIVKPTLWQQLKAKLRG